MLKHSKRRVPLHCLPNAAAESSPTSVSDWQSHAGAETVLRVHTHNYLLCTQPQKGRSDRQKEISSMKKKERERAFLRAGSHFTTPDTQLQY